MLIRNAPLILGVICILAGLPLAYVWLTNQDASVEEAKPIGLLFAYETSR